MAHVDDERALRAVLTDMTAWQPPAPPHRYGTVRRMAVLHRRRQLAGVAAAVAVLVAAAIAIPGLLRVGQPAPSAPRHYRISVLPGPGAPRDLIASGVLSQYHWQAFVRAQRGDEICSGTTFTTTSGTGWECFGGPPPLATQTGDPVANFSAGGGPGVQIGVGTVRSDVVYLKVAYNDGRVLIVYPVAVFGHRYASWFALPAPYDGAVTQITAYAKTGELGYAIPFTGASTGITIERWLRPGQSALPRPASYEIGSGTANGTRWHDHVYVGPWGTCFVHPTGAFNCFAQTGWLLSPSAMAGQIGLGHESNVAYVYGQARPSVSYLVVTMSHGGTARIPVVSAGSRKFYAFASLDKDPVVAWIAYDAAGHELGSGNVSI